jgi:hypothetical protein
MLLRCLFCRRPRDAVGWQVQATQWPALKRRWSIPDPFLPDFFGFSLLLSVATGGSPAEAKAGVIAGAAISAIENIAKVVSLIAKRLTSHS